MGLARFIFRHRFWVFAAVFFVGFSTLGFDQTPTAVRLARLAAGGGTAGAAGVRVAFGIGALLVVAATGLRTWATAYLRSTVVHDTHLHAEALVADGPYRRVRNPLYLGAVLMSLGFALLAPAAGAVVMVAGVLGVVMALVTVEEAALAQSLPVRFAEYRARVPRLLPAPTPRVPAGDARPAWAQAFVGEAFFWSFAAGAVALAVTLDARWAGAIAVVGVALQPLLHRRLRAGGAPITARR